MVHAATAMNLTGPRRLRLEWHVARRLGLLAGVVDDDDSFDGTAARLLHDDLHLVHVPLLGGKVALRKNA